MHKSNVKAIPKKPVPMPFALHTKAMSFNELAMRYLASHTNLLSQSMLNVRIAHLSEQLLAFFRGATAQRYSARTAAEIYLYP